ncbi:hypothetical protein GCM10010502_69090 [Kitasatospora aureofaciens]|uniref:Uncharacterized protein n=1 Tax=Kitasatospora aureofaciens TaxID=1894 RepID=A0A8H9I0K3_KITAU|nr:hypothetical protein GCM10010502_69090 [Kitasatospora aureofaciens]
MGRLQHLRPAVFADDNRTHIAAHGIPLVIDADGDRAAPDRLAMANILVAVGIACEVGT